MKIGVISGHVIDVFTTNAEEIEVETPYGNILLWYTKKGSREIFFLNRHGKNANLPPHKINYQAIIHALKVSNVDCILSLGTVGSLKSSIKPGEIVVPHDFIDFTKNRVYTFYDNKRIHVDMSNPFCPSLRDILRQGCEKLRLSYHAKGVYLATEGPRLETPAEIKMFSSFADVVGMTIVPEAVLAREKEMCYASLCLVCNMAAGLQSSLSADEIAQLVAEKKPVLAKLLQKTIDVTVENRTCTCRNALEKAIL